MQWWDISIIHMSYFHDSLCNSLLLWREWKKKQSSQSRKGAQEWMHIDERAWVLPATGAVLLGLQNREITTSTWKNKCFKVEKSLWYLPRVSAVIEEGSTNFSHCYPLIFLHRTPLTFSLRHSPCRDSCRTRSGGSEIRGKMRTEGWWHRSAVLSFLSLALFFFPSTYS